MTKLLTVEKHQFFRKLQCYVEKLQHFSKHCFSVIVLEAGHVREFDAPQKLLEDRKSLFYSMVRAASGGGGGASASSGHRTMAG